MTGRTLITVIGKSAKDPADPVSHEALRAAEEVGRQVARRGAVVVCGGLSGVMEAACRGAKAEGGITVGILPGEDRDAANPYVDIPIATGLDAYRDILNVLAGDAVIMISGGIGTLQELTQAYEKRHTIVLLGTDDWADRLPDVAYEGRYLDKRRSGYLHYAKTPAEAVELAFKLAKEPRPSRSLVG